MSKLRSPINCATLELELQQAVKADQLYRLQNDAKLRAVEQNVPTYENFRQMVNAAHLKPVQHADFKSMPRKLWNPVAHMDDSNVPILPHRINGKECENCVQLSSKEENTFQAKIPTTYQQFVETWKTIKGSKAKFHCVQMLRHTLREKIFRAEIPSQLLVELINTCFENISIVHRIEPILHILSILSECNRFRLAVSFMGENERKTCERLFRRLLIHADCQNQISKDTVKALASSYQVTLE